MKLRSRFRITQNMLTFAAPRYRELIHKRQAESLTPDEQTELIARSDYLEDANVKRIEYLTQLATLRKTTLPAIMKEPGLKPASYF